MCVILLPGDLNSSPCPKGVTTALRVHSDINDTVKRKQNVIL